MTKTKIQSIKFNYIMNSILTLSSIIFPLITFPYVSRILNPVGMGKISFATSVIIYFSMFAQLGIPTYGIRACAKVRDDKAKLSKVVQEIIIINLVMCLVVYIVFFFALFTIPRLQGDRTLFLIISFTIIFNAFGVEWLYKGLEQYSYITIRSIIFKFIALIATFFLVKEQMDYVIYGGITILASVGSNVFNFINLRKYVYIRPSSKLNFKKHMKPITIFFAMSIATTVYTNLDTVMLGVMKTDEDVGYYNAAVKVKTVLVNFVASLGTVLLPRVSYYIEYGMRDEFERITKKALNFVMLIASPLIIYFIIFAKEAILLLSGEAYIGSIIPMQIIMPTILFIGLTNIMGIQMLVPLGKEKIVLYSVIAGAVVNLIFNAVMISKYASSGAAIGTLIAEFVVFIVQLIALKDTVIPIYKKISYWKILISLGGASGLSFWTNINNTSNSIRFVISACIFFVVYSLILTLLKESLVIEYKDKILVKFKKI